MKLIALLSAVALAGSLSACSTTHPPVVTKIVSIPVTVDENLFELPSVPKPPTAAEFENTNAREKMAILGDKIVLLYGHIEKLEERLLGIKQVMRDKAKRIEEGNKE